MMDGPWTAEVRAHLRREMDYTKKQSRLTADHEEFDVSATWLEKYNQVEAAYVSGLPRVVMSCCPFCGEPLVRTFDPMGLDGLWWNDFSAEELPTCPHFCVLGGAVNFNGQKPWSGNQQVFPGPEIPFVYPRLFALPGVVTVISSLPMENGYLAYPIAYFAEKRPPGEQLVAGWLRKVHHWNDQLGGSGWRIENDKWDFVLRPWLEQGKVRWTAPDSDRTVLSQEAWDRCPYLDLPGQHKAISVYRDRFSYRNPPNGSDISPYDD